MSTQSTTSVDLLKSKPEAAENLLAPNSPVVGAGNDQNTGGGGSPPSPADLQRAKQAAVESLLRRNGDIPGGGVRLHGVILGVGIGHKDVGGEKADCVRIYVSDKEYCARLGVVPDYFLKVPTSVVQVGRFGRNGCRPKVPTESPVADSATNEVFARPGSPIRVSTTAPNVNEGQRGTLGAVITDGSGKDYILSCNHVLSVNGRVLTDPNAEVLLAEFVGDEFPIAHRGDYFVRLQRNEGNPADCAAALIKQRAPVHPKFRDGTLQLSATSAVPAVPGNGVQKVGAVTLHTTGTIVDVDADLYIDYSFGTFRFDNQVMIDGGYDELDKAFATAGDSGSLLVDSKSMQPTALIFAASGRFAVACPLRTGKGTGVLEQLEVQMKGPLSFVTQ